VARRKFEGEVKVLTSCPSCLQGLARYNDDAGTDADYIVVEIAKHLLGPGWMADYVAKSQSRRHRARVALGNGGLPQKFLQNCLELPAQRETN